MGLEDDHVQVRELDARHLGIELAPPVEAPPAHLDESGGIEADVGLGGEEPGCASARACTDTRRLENDDATETGAATGEPRGEPEHPAPHDEDVGTPIEILRHPRIEGGALRRAQLVDPQGVGEHRPSP